MFYCLSFCFNLFGVSCCLITNMSRIVRIPFCVCNSAVCLCIPFECCCVTSIIFMFCVCVVCSCARSVFLIRTTSTYFTMRIQICVRCNSSGLILVRQLSVLHVLYVCCVFWVVTLCSQLLCLCLPFCCVRVVALVCLCRLQSCVVFLPISLFFVILYCLFC